MLYLRRILRPSFCLNVQRTYQIKYQVDDVTIIRGLSKGQPYIKLKGFTIPLSVKSMAGQLMLPSTGVYGVKEMPAIFLDQNFDMYHPTVPIALIIKQSFFIQWEGHHYYILTNQPLIKISSNPEYHGTNAPSILEPICRASLRDVDDYKTITNKLIRNILFKNTMQEALELKIAKIRYKQILKIVEQKLQVFEVQLKQIAIDSDRRARKRVTRFTSFLLGQFALINYLIYFHFSWDIMEPVTCILGNIDVLVGYYFFIWKGKQFSFGVMHQDAIQAKQNHIMRKNGLDVEKYNELKDIRNYLTYRLSFLSKNKHKLLDQFQGKFHMLDTR